MDFNETSVIYYYDYYEFYQNYSQFDVGHINYMCRVFGASTVWLFLKGIILLTALPANLTLLGLVVRGKIPASSQTIGINLSIVNVLYCAFLPLDICTGVRKFSKEVVSASEAFSTLNFVGCPLLATGMCVERYIAVSWPIFYLELKRSLYREVFSVLVWILTLIMAVLTYFNGLQSFSWLFTMVISVLFLLMNMCLGGIIFVLRKKGPGDNEKDTPQKKKALKNVLAVLCPFTVAYLPIVALIPFQYLVVNQKKLMSATNCTIFYTLFFFPNYGTYISPMFFLSHLTKHLSCRIRRPKQDQTQGRTTQVFSHSSFATNQNTTVSLQPP